MRPRAAAVYTKDEMAAARRSRLIAISGLLLASGIVHYALLALMPRAVERRVPIDVTVIAVELRGDRTAEPEGGTPHVVPPGTAPRVATEHAAAPSTLRAPRAGAAQLPEGTAAVAPPPEVATSPVTPAHPRAVPDRRPDIAPRAAALSTLAATESIAEPTPDDRAATRSEQLSAELEAIANANPAREPRHPDLVRDPDGTCHYDGDAIAATILPDGGVRFEDKPSDVRAVSVEPLARGQLLPRGGARVPPANPVTPEDQIADQRLELRIKVTPRAWKAERDWFLRETEGVRRELADAAHARELAAGEHALRKRLDKIWCDTSVPVTERRRALFAVWDEMSADEVGAQGRREVLRYVRENLPKGSAQAFPEEQLAELNLGRAPADRFDPYAGARSD
jgi:hypothetical protein